MSILSKISSSHQSSKQASSESQVPSTPSKKDNPLPPSLTTSALSDSATPAAGGSSENRLRRIALESLVDVLRSLVAWGAAAKQNAEAEAGMVSQDPQTQSSISISLQDDSRPESTSGIERLPDRLLSPLPRGSSVDFRRSTPDLVDDPTRFESAKQRKTKLMEGIQKFNFKQSKVCLLIVS